VDHEVLDLREDLSYPEYPIRILDQAGRWTRQKAIKFLKVQWSNHSQEEATWEREDRLHDEYPSLFSVYLLNLGTRFSFRGGEL
jgi:hypothetical protein